jgi:predicted DNA-binding transcriptional regulator AlpA
MPSAAAAPAPPPQALTEPEAARYIAYSVPFLRLTRRENRGPAFIRIGRSIRYRIADLDAWMAAHRVTTREAR